MKDSTDAIRYARALEAALTGAPQLEKTAEELGSVAAALASDHETAQVLTNPGLEPALRDSLVNTIITAGKLSTPAAHFLRLLAERGHLGLLPEAAAALGRIRDRRMGIVEAEVTTATPIGEELASRTKQTLEKTTGCRVRLSFKTDPAIIGGMVARVGGTVFDGSVRARLDGMRAHLARS